MRRHWEGVVNFQNWGPFLFLQTTKSTNPLPNLVPTPIWNPILLHSPTFFPVTIIRAMFGTKHMKMVWASKWGPRIYRPRSATNRTMIDSWGRMSTQSSTTCMKFRPCAYICCNILIVRYLAHDASRLYSVVFVPSLCPANWNKG